MVSNDSSDYLDETQIPTLDTWRFRAGIKYGWHSYFRRVSDSSEFPSSCSYSFYFRKFLNCFIHKTCKKPYVCFSLILAWFELSCTAQYFFLRIMFFRASIEIVPSFTLITILPYSSEIHFWTSIKNGPKGRWHCRSSGYFIPKLLDNWHNWCWWTSALPNILYSIFCTTTFWHKRHGRDRLRRWAWSLHIPRHVWGRLPIPILENCKGNASLSSKSSPSAGSKCLKDLLCLRNFMAEGPWRRKKSLSLRIPENL